MKFHSLVPGWRKKSKRRVGRGLGSGRGKTAGRGTKGQKARSGFNVPRRFEGGQTAFIQRLPKAGGFPIQSTQYPVVSVEKVNASFAIGDRVSPRTLAAKGLISTMAAKAKLVGPGKLTKFVRLENIVLTKKLAASLPTPPKARISQATKPAPKMTPRKSARATRKKG